METMTTLLSRIVWVSSLCVASWAIADQKPSTEPERVLVTGDFKWVSTEPLMRAREADGEKWHSIKDPSIVRFNNRWHLFCTVRGKQRSHAIVYVSFADWAEARSAPHRILSCHQGFFCAPQVFYFSPHKKWYLICQASDESWTPNYQAAFATTSDISNPQSWSALRPLGAKAAQGKSGLDFWIICDAAKAHLFFTTLDGRMWREETPLEQFPGGWSSPALALQDDLFEASHTYRLDGRNQYLTLVEAQGAEGRRYFKAYLAERLGGQWHPLAAEKQKTFASAANVTQTGGRWTDSISHGELIRSGYDQELTVNPKTLIFLFKV
jgi:hypothetical protein